MKFENFAYRRLNAYIEAKSLTILVYGTLKKFPKEETYALCDQLRRAVVFIPSNIAEGCSRSSIKEQIHFIEIAYGSLNETLCQLEIARELGYITQMELMEIEKQAQKVGALLWGLRKSKKNDSA